MKIANADKLKKHFESVVDVHLFTVPTILTIIDTFSSEVDENDLISRSDLQVVTSKVVAEEIKEYEMWAIGLRYALKLIDDAPPANIGGTKP